MNDSEPSWTRRDFLKVGAAAGGGLLVGVGLPRCATHDDVTAGPAAALGAFVEIDERGGVTILAPCPEIGQGVRTALPRIVAEELGAEWSRVTVRQAPAEERYGGMTVGGSDSVRDYWEPLRTAGATARTLLVAAAAARWGVPAPECRARRGQVIHETSDRRLGFGDLAAEAAQLPAPENVQLREPAEFELIGRRVGRIDVAPIVDGTAGFGMDVRMPGMAYAVIERRRVLTTAAEAAGWGTPLPERRGRGIACCYYKGSYAAHVAEVSVDEDDRVRVDRVVAALDCGRIVDPTGLAAQVEGAAMDGVATVLKWGVTLEAGRVRQGNFDDHPMLRIQEAPKVESHLLNSDRAPTGAGEPPYPSVAPAIANAIHAAAGARVRQLPLDDGRLPPA